VSPFLILELWDFTLPKKFWLMQRNILEWCWKDKCDDFCQELCGLMMKSKLKAIWDVKQTCPVIIIILYQSSRELLWRVGVRERDMIQCLNKFWFQIHTHIYPLGWKGSPLLTLSTQTSLVISSNCTHKIDNPISCLCLFQASSVTLTSGADLTLKYHQIWNN